MSNQSGEAWPGETRRRLAAFDISQARESRCLSAGETIAPAEALMREQALRAATINGAYVTWEEDSKGSIESGKLADRAVLSHDPLTADEDVLKDIYAELTFVDGRILFITRHANRRVAPFSPSPSRGRPGWERV